VEGLVHEELGITEENKDNLVDLLKQQLKEDMNVRLRLLFDNFESASQKRVNSIGRENDDPTVYIGTGGISYALFRAVSALEVS
jgi:hypothetical protein